MNLGRIFKRKKRQLTLEEIRAVREIYERKNCAYCRYLFAAVTLWCHNDGAIKARGTKIPGLIITLIGVLINLILEKY